MLRNRQRDFSKAPFVDARNRFLFSPTEQIDAQATFRRNDGIISDNTLKLPFKKPWELSKVTNFLQKYKFSMAKGIEKTHVD